MNRLAVAILTAIGLFAQPPVRQPLGWVFEEHGYRAGYTETGKRAHIVAARPEANVTTVCGIEVVVAESAEQLARAHASPLCKRCVHEGQLWHPGLRDRMARWVRAWP